MTLRTTVKTAWDGIMNERRNPLRSFPLMTAHMVMQVLAWMWSTIFAIAIGSYIAFGVSVVGHVLVLAGVFITLAVFQKAEQARPARVRVTRA